MRSILSFDLHLRDAPGNIETCTMNLAEAGIRAAFFIPTRMIEGADFRGPLRALAAAGHELGTHCHEHNDEEMRALMGGNEENLRFLEASAASFADFFGYRPRIFRSPCWCRLGRIAKVKLAELGYHVDSSSAPQRPGIFSHFFLDNHHLFAPRAPYFIMPGLLEVPTSCFLVPLGWPTFCAFREKGTALFLKLLMLEAALRDTMVVVPQFHPSDFSPEGGAIRHDRRRWRDLIPRGLGGMQARRWFRLSDRRRLVAIACSIVAALGRGNLTSFELIYKQMTDVKQPRAAGMQPNWSPKPLDRPNHST
jgi:hypothetical protein